MRRGIYVAIAIVLVILALIPYLYIEWMKRTTLKTTIHIPGKELLETTVPLNEIIVEVNDNHYVVIKPLSWRELFSLYLNKEASFKYIFGGLDRFYVEHVYFRYIIERRVNKTYACEVVRREYGGSILLKNNCEILEKLIFSNERSWYLDYALVPIIIEEALKKYRSLDKYYIYALVYLSDRGLEVVVANILDQKEKEKIVNELKKIINNEEIVVIQKELVLTYYRANYWYDEFEYLVNNNITKVWLMDIDAKGDFNNTEFLRKLRFAREDLIRPFVEQYVIYYDPYDPMNPIDETEGLIFIDGELKLIITLAPCEYVKEVKCTDDTDVIIGVNRLKKTLEELEE